MKNLVLSENDWEEMNEHDEKVRLERLHEVQILLRMKLLLGDSEDVEELTEEMHELGGHL